tara:strand:+ start:1237 stop:1473 length:237 start_codon:yes stop_codon:yes gene_type:complete
MKEFSIRYREIRDFPTHTVMECRMLPRATENHARKFSILFNVGGEMFDIGQSGSIEEIKYYLTYYKEKYGFSIKEIPE